MSYLVLRAACSALDVIEASRVKVANALGIDGDGNVIPDRLGHVFEPVRLMIPDPDTRRRSAVNITPLVGLELAESAARKKVVKALRDAASPELREWAEAEQGVGEITLARLLGEIGNPRQYQPMTWIENPDFDDEKLSSRENPKRLLVADGDPVDRTLRMLWQYSRVGNFESHPRHFERRGIEASQENLFASGRPRVRQRLFVCADVIVRQSYRFRDDPRLADLIAAAQKRLDSQTARGGSDDPSLDAQERGDRQICCGVENPSVGAHGSCDCNESRGANDPSPCAQRPIDGHPSHGAGEPSADEVTPKKGADAEIAAASPRLPLGIVYLARKAATEGRVHTVPCCPCRADVGDPWRPGHRDADAKRIVAKELLRAIWELS